MLSIKKGALELSMSTIIVIVLGVVLLSLGLLFIRGLFGEITKISDDVFINAQNEIENIGRSGKLSVRNIIEIEQGDTNPLPIFVTNDGSVGTGEKSFTLELRPNGNFEDQVKAKIVSPPTATLKQGDSVEYTVQVVAVGSAPLSLDASYQVIVTCNGCSSNYATGGFVIKVTERSGLFG